jgi:dipeptidyl aminopeptidase/acylaminoacyl peptidase
MRQFFCNKCIIGQNMASAFACELTAHSCTPAVWLENRRYNAQKPKRISMKLFHVKKCTSISAGLVLLLPLLVARAQDAKSGQDVPAAQSRDGKKLFSTAAALRVARVSAPRISPDGLRVAYLVSDIKTEKDKPWKSVEQLWVVPAAGPASAARQYTRGEESVSAVQWSPDGKVIAFLMNAGDEKDKKPQVWFMYADGGEPWQVTKHKPGVRSFDFSPDGKTLALVALDPESSAQEQRTKEKDDAQIVDHNLKLPQLWTWEIATGQAKEIVKGKFAVSDARWSPDGMKLSFTENPTPLLNDTWRQTAWTVDVASGEQHKLQGTSRYTHTVRWSPDGKSIAFLTNEGNPEFHTSLDVARADGSECRNVSEKFELNAAEPVWAADNKTIYFSANVQQLLEVFQVNVAAASVEQITAKQGVLTLAQISKDGHTAVGTWTDPMHPAEIFRSDPHFGKVEPITDQNAWLKDYALGQTEVIHWTSKDGTEVDGVLTKPVDFGASRKYPFLLNPHGGPTGASLLSFNPTEQVMAANGYLLLEPNFRGSTGRGEKYARANEKDWGGGDYQDDMTGVDAVVQKGWADPERLGAYGWSYGGYMTFWIDTQTDRFKAISPGAGLPDLYSMYSQTDIHNYISLFFGLKAPWDNFDEYWKHSPMKYVDQVKTPTMILHGQADTRVPIAQAEEFYQALKERDLPVEFVTYPRENHGFTEPRHIQDRMQRYLVFFGKYLNNPPKTEPKETIERMEKDLPAAKPANTASIHPTPNS